MIIPLEQLLEESEAETERVTVNKMLNDLTELDVVLGVTAMLLILQTINETLKLVTEGKEEKEIKDILTKGKGN